MHLSLYVCVCWLSDVSTMLERQVVKHPEASSAEEVSVTPTMTPHKSMLYDMMNYTLHLVFEQAKFDHPVPVHMVCRFCSIRARAVCTSATPLSP